jgi:hypothetical protein
MADIAVRGSKKTTFGRDPLVFANFTKAQAAAIQALAAGKANEGQQKAAIDWIIRAAARSYDQTHHGERTHDAAFVDGQRFVGNQIIALINAQLGKFED